MLLETPEAKAPPEPRVIGLSRGDVLGGRYRVTRVLGQGGMSVVYEAEHVRLGQRVAIKILRPELAQHAEIVERFEREGRAVGRLRSPHVARVHDVDVTPRGLPFLAMELLEGRDLAEEIEIRGALPVDDAVRWIREACSAVAEANERGLVHRDLKPSNLFLTDALGGRRRSVKVLDFGIASEASSDDALRITRTEIVMGTPAYMAPEQFRSAKNVDARVDVWALGATLFEALAGRPPFLGTPTNIGVIVTSDPPPDLASIRSDVPLELVAVVMRALEKDRDQRYPSVRDFARALAPFSRDAIDEAPGDASARARRRASDPGMRAATPASSPRMPTPHAPTPQPRAAIPARAPTDPSPRAPTSAGLVTTLAPPARTWIGVLTGAALTGVLVAAATFSLRGPAPGVAASAMEAPWPRSPSVASEPAPSAPSLASAAPLASASAAPPRAAASARVDHPAPPLK